MFWGIEVTKESVKFTPPYDVHLTTACLSASAKGTERNVLIVKHDGKEYAICSLRINGQEHSSLDLIFEEGQEVEFKVVGPNAINLTGYFVSQMEGAEDDGEEEDDEEMESDEEGMEDEDDEEDEEVDDEEMQRQIQKALQGIKKETAAEANNKRVATKSPETAPQPQKKVKSDEAPQQPKQQQSKQQPQQKAASPAKEEKKPQQPSVKKYPNGLIVQDIVVGTGQETTRGKAVEVLYVGKLHPSGKVFDSSLRSPFKFRLGVGEVIKGWDLGVDGMRVGGKRRLTIPSQLGYGARGAKPDIPPHATLVFDVELTGTK